MGSYIVSVNIKTITKSRNYLVFQIDYRLNLSNGVNMNKSIAHLISNRLQNKLLEISGVKRM